MQHELVLVAFTMQYELFLAASFITVHYVICLAAKVFTGQYVLFLVVPFITELYIKLCLAVSFITVQY